MNAKIGSAAATETTNFEPSSDLIQEQDCDTLLLYLPDFKKEQLLVQLTRSGVLRISGTRPLGEKKFTSFQKDFPSSPNIDTNSISAKFEGGILYVRQPKKLTIPTHKQDTTELPPSETSLKNDQDQETTRSDDQIKQKSANDIPDKSSHKEEEEEEEEEEDNTKLDKNADRKEKNGGIDDQNKAETETNSDHFDSQLVNKASIRKNVIPAAKLQMKLNMVLAIFLAFAFGMYFRSRVWCANETEK